MSSLPTVPDEQIARLVADGYDMVLAGGHLVVRRLPYMSTTGLRRDGRIVLPVTYTAGAVADATDHRIWFAGDEPQDSQGVALGSAGHAHGFGNGEVADHMLSFKPSSGAYGNLYEKIRHYAHILLSAARQVDADVSATPGGSF
ncbi:hypothetical protein CH254_04490 [Rhodococcus sp. 06-412-2C]|uniref:DUF6791 domain-containing protein n=1 Tax=unclassified Rhodococcus (in: high G+C Gram-positive bacteria) TaxID=192944 RepID=UPI000BC47658|nr:MULTISPECIES: DUF6791 domain-containing protein [unclassified Rhodococcus (in: high G+C Gram-positive bacteria)]OZC91742.1 hypothetical protein CH254_04490 [Rhodococcus sp. 06-412-2C]OZC92310.1 hypothetical protein CH279_25765 [Rhodococcus sp. 06-412-2B]